MKRAAIRLIGASVVFLAMAPQAFSEAFFAWRPKQPQSTRAASADPSADDQSSGLSVGFRAGAALPEEDDADNSFALGGFVAQDLHEYLRLELESGWIRVDQDILGDLHVFPLLLNAQVPFRNSSRFTPYGTVGIGGLFFNFDESNLVESVGASVDVDPAFATKLGAGLDVSLVENVSLNLDAGYVFASTDADFKQGSTVLAADDVEADYWIISLGARVEF